MQASTWILCRDNPGVACNSAHLGNAFALIVAFVVTFLLQRELVRLMQTSHLFEEYKQLSTNPVGICWIKYELIRIGDLICYFGKYLSGRPGTRPVNRIISKIIK